eukprot:CAMPEP_0181244994 /NCGR_PEP_ID=MMETSP1096-20121128/43171_1 /TAXON_ID=156174 ORGANISM="Chrysochromulina ericina, Strain CCMP281" /NCGR_SAMPLE_ID=MMETSP1096 /ASSEMBLY_ACC=CAM_ASM_000453 /LENGTH=168 /DNA_ID=CAMNT_0023341609 /DNA_START=155 /DNA_END=657 /DNA_ORIENTATION=-
MCPTVTASGITADNRCIASTKKYRHAHQATKPYYMHGTNLRTPQRDGPGAPNGPISNSSTTPRAQGAARAQQPTADCEPAAVPRRTPPFTPYAAPPAVMLCLWLPLLPIPHPSPLRRVRLTITLTPRSSSYPSRGFPAAATPHSQPPQSSSSSLVPSPFPSPLPATPS